MIFALLPLFAQDPEVIIPEAAVNAESLRPASSQALYAVEDPGSGATSRLVTTWSHKPLVLELSNGETVNVVGGVISANLLLGWEHGPWRVSANAPLHLCLNSDVGTASPSFGDPDLSLRWSTQRDTPMQAGVSARVVPSFGASVRRLGYPTLTGDLLGLWAWNHKAHRLIFNLGFAYRPPADSTGTPGDSAVLARGAWLLSPSSSLTLGLELNAQSLPQAWGENIPSNSAEMLLGARWSTGPLRVMAAAGPGLGQVPGTPALRVALGAELRPTGPDQRPPDP